MPNPFEQPPKIETPPEEEKRVEKPDKKPHTKKEIEKEISNLRERVKLSKEFNKTMGEQLRAEKEMNQFAKDFLPIVKEEAKDIIRTRAKIARDAAELHTRLLEKKLTRQQRKGKVKQTLDNIKRKIVG